MRTSAVILLLATVLWSCGGEQSETATATTAAADSVTVIDLASPLDFPLSLAGNFGELRPYHFHGGLDFKTKGTTGHAVRSVERGYVSAVEVSPWGYGRAVFVTHPAIGLVTVYGHLEAFSPKIEKLVEAEQIKKESFSVDISFTPDQIPVERGEIIGKSGNAGSSAGPHLHFETRRIDADRAIDPMQFYADRIADRTPPEVRRLSLIPLDCAVVDGASGKPARRGPDSFNKPFTAWGKVAPAIEAFDRMDNSSNIFGIKHLSLFVDSVEMYRRTIDHFDFPHNRAINSLVYFPDYAEGGRWTMTTYNPPTHPLSDIVTTNAFDGVIYVLEERTYHCEFVLADHFGNSFTLPFLIEGKKAPCKAVEHKGETVGAGSIRLIDTPDAKVVIMPFTLFEPTDIEVTSKADSRFLSPVVSIGDSHIAVKQPFMLAMPIPAGADKTKLCMVRVSDSGFSFVESKPHDNFLVTEAKRFGRYAVTTDTRAPSIGGFSGVATIPGDTTATAPKQLSLRISDDLSGIASFKCYIDGRFVVFDHDGKTATISRRLDGFPRRGKPHRLKVIVTDAVGNTNETSFDFTW